jgi:hypothetical protein
MLQLKVSNFLMPSQPPKVLKLKSLKFAECLYTYLRGLLKDKISNSVPVGTTKLSNHQDLKKENL